MLKGVERPVTGLEISSSQIAAVKVKGSSRLIDVAGVGPLRDGIVRDGEVIDPQSLAEAIHELFAARKLPHTVRLGITNQSTVMRVVELPPGIDRRDIYEAVRLQLPETIPLPADDVVFSHQVLGPVETPSGIRTRVVVVAARKRMVDDFLAAVNGAGLKPVGVDLCAFALIRAVYRADEDAGESVAYLGIGGLSHLSVAQDGACTFTRVLGAGEDQMASQLLGRLGLARDRAHQVLLEVGAEDLSWSDPDATPAADSELTRTVRDTIISGVRRIADESRASLDFYAAQPHGVPAVKLVVSGSAVSIPGLTERLAELLPIPVQSRVSADATPGALTGIDPAQLQVALGLTTAEIPE